MSGQTQSGYVVTLPDPQLPAGRRIVVRGPFATVAEAAAARDARIGFDGEPEATIEMADPARVVLDARELLAD